MTIYSGFRRKARVIKWKRFGRQKGGHRRRCSLRGPRKLGMRVRQLVLLRVHVLAIPKQHNLKNAVVCEDCFEKIDVLYTHVTYKRTRRSW